jgi:hypothetical protein
MFRRVKTLTSVIAAATVLSLAPPVFAQAQTQESEQDAFEPNEAYIIGNAYFFVYHEAGHMLMSELRLNASNRLGNSEQAADTIATLLLMPDEADKDEEAKEGVLSSEDLIEAVADGWTDSAMANGARPPNGKHPPDEERAHSVLCLLYGSDATYFADLKPFLRSPPACESEYQQKTEVWTVALAPHFMPEGQNSGQVQVRYETPTADLREAMESISGSQVLEDVASDINEYLRLPRPVLLRAATCKGRADATWNAARREMTICYELVQWFIDQDRANATGEDTGGTAEAGALPETDEDGNPIEHGGNKGRKRPR